MNLSTIHQAELQKRPRHVKKQPEHPKTLRSTPVIINPDLEADPSAGRISDKLYSGFIEHLGRCIYGGLLDNPNDPSPSELLAPQDDGTEVTAGELGWRTDVQKILTEDLRIPMMRWPGGNFVSNYHWQDGIGPIADRPHRMELAWLGEPETNAFGTNEFIRMCRANKWEPYICLNMGTGTLEEALAWLEYCNGTGNTYWANLRRKHTGRDELHAVKYWGLGNEMWGPWQVGNMTATEYAATARKWAHALKLVDPTIQLVSCGETGWSDWDREVLQSLVPFVDHHSFHFYTMLGSEPEHSYENNVFGPAAAERGIQIAAALVDLANIDNTMRGIPARRVKIAFDEWNVWDTAKAGPCLEQRYDYTDMLGVCAWLNVLVRNHAVMEIACLAQSVNVIAPIMTSPTGVMRQTIFWPLKLFAQHMTGKLLQTPAFPDVYDGPSYPAFVQQLLRPSYVDLVAVYDDGRARVSVLNRHPEVDWEADIRMEGPVEVIELYSEVLAAVNTFDDEVIAPTVTRYSADEWRERKHRVRKHSWQLIVQVQ